MVLLPVLFLVRIFCFRLFSRVGVVTDVEIIFNEKGSKVNKLLIVSIMLYLLDKHFPCTVCIPGDVIL